MSAPTFFLVRLLFSLLTLINMASAEGRSSYLHFAYPGFQAPVYFDEYEGLLGPNVLKMCVRREYPPENGQQCRGSMKVCLWGSQRCGSDNHLEPTSRCNCKNNEWTCQAFLCPTMGGATCPAKPSLGQDISTLPICKTDLACAYEDKACAGCNVTLPTIQCSCQAGQPFTCQQVDLCSSDVKCYALKVAEETIKATQEGGLLPDSSLGKPATEGPPTTNITTSGSEEQPPQVVEEQIVLPLFPEPIIVEVKNDVPPPPSFKTNDPLCPVDAPTLDVNSTKTVCTEEGLNCQYGYSCCCADNSQCSADLKCECTNGVLECKSKTCDAFLCLGPPPLLESPFHISEPIITTGLICPQEEVALTTKTCVVETGMEFYHCVYSYSCCCPNSPSGADFSGRYCSSDLQCTCNEGVFTCDVAACPECPVEADDVKCPAEKPQHLSECPNPEGETCGFGEVKCCNDKIHAASYCTCQGNGLWNCFDAKYLCEMEIC